MKNLFKILIPILFTFSFGRVCIDGEEVDSAEWVSMTDENQDLVYEATLSLLPNYTYGPYLPLLATKSSP